MIPEIEPKKLNFRLVKNQIIGINVILAIIYLSWWLDLRNAGHPLLYFLLLFGELYHIFMSLTFWFTVYPKAAQKLKLPDKSFSLNNGTSVDVFIPVTNEPLDIIENTASNAKNLDYQNKNIYILNDGFVAGRKDWNEVVRIGNKLNISVITRSIGGGAKAGNINNAISLTSGEIIAIFDSDMAVKKEFLKKVLPYFSDPSVAFVQTPQFYKNSADNDITKASWDMQSFFFGPIMEGKDKDNAAFICGTNVAIKRSALLAVGGMSEDSIAEDFLTSIKIHQKGYKSKYINEILAEGLAPYNLIAFYKQQQRWSRGSLEVLVSENPLFIRGLTWKQKIHYLSSALYYANGLIVIIDIIMPLIFLYTGIEPISATTYHFAFFFLPYIFFVLATLGYISSGGLSMKAISLSYSLFFMQFISLLMTLIRIKIPFKVTPKEGSSGNYLYLAIPHILYFLLSITGIYFVLNRQIFNSAVATNLAWIVFNLAMFYPFVKASYNWDKLFKQLKTPDFIPAVNVDMVKV